MTPCRIRAGRGAAATGTFEWSGPTQPREAGPCELVLASDVVALQRLDVPPAQRRRLSGALHFLVEDLVLSDPERLHVVEAAGSPKDAFCVGIVERAWLQAVLGRLAGLGFKPERVLVETLLPELAPGAWTVVWNGPANFVRTGAAEGFALDLPEADAVPVALRLAAEKSPPASIAVRTAPGTPVPDAERWSQALGVPVHAGPPWSWSEARGEQSLDFLQGELALDRGESGWRARLKRPAALAASLVVIASFGIAADWAAKAQERSALVAQMNAIYRDTFGQAAVLIDPPLQMHRALAELKQRSGEPGASDFPSLLAALSVRMLDPAKQRIESMSYRQGRLTVVLRPHDPAAFAALVEELRGKTPIQGLEVKIEAVESGGARQLRVTASTESGRWALARP